VERASRLTSVRSAHALSMHRILQLGGSGGIQWLPWKSLENGYCNIKSRGYFQWMNFVAKFKSGIMHYFLLLVFKKLYNSDLSKRINSVQLKTKRLFKTQD